jgi:hypothetical protein
MRFGNRARMDVVPAAAAGVEGIGPREDLRVRQQRRAIGKTLATKRPGDSFS